MDFRILGSVDVFSEGQPVRLAGPRQRALLAYLLLHPGEVTSAERLLGELWHEPPRGGAAAVQTHVSRLRRALGGRIATSGAGYSLQVEPGELDLDRFRSLLADAGRASEPFERSRVLRAADELWHGSPLHGLDAPFVAAEVYGLDELRLAAIEARLDADLEAGRGAELVSELSGLIARNPLRERFRAQLILSLYRNGRQAEALEAYQEARRMLAEELGLEPGPTLRGLERAILRHDPSLIPAPEPKARLQPEDASPNGRFPLALAAAVALATAGLAAAAVVFSDTDAHTRIAAAPSTHAARGEPAPSRPVAVVRQKLRRHPRASVRHAPRRRAVFRTRTVIAPSRLVTTPATVVVPMATTTVTTTTLPPPARRHPRTATKPPPATTTTSNRGVTPPAPPTPVVISDTFDSPVIDGTIWYQIHEGDGWTLSQHDGHLEVSFPPGTTPGPPYGNYGGHVGTLCKFPGDFDARIDYTLPMWPAANGTFVSLWVFFAPNNLAWDVGRQSTSQGGEQYGSFTGPGSSYSVSLDDTTGTLRLVRRKGVVTTYFLHNGRWVSLTYGTNTSYATIAVGAIGPEKNSSFGGQQVTVDFDNFQVSAVNPACPPGSLPS